MIRMGSPPSHNAARCWRFPRLITSERRDNRRGQYNGLGPNWDTTLVVTTVRFGNERKTRSASFLRSLKRTRARSLVDFEVPANHNPATVRFLNFLEKNVGGIRYSASESAEIRSVVDDQKTGSRLLGHFGQLHG